MGDEVTSEEAPKWAVAVVADAVLVGDDNRHDLVSRRSVGEVEALLDEDLVGEVAIGDEDHTGGSDLDGEDGAILVGELVKDRAKVGGGVVYPHEVAQEWNS